MLSFLKKSRFKNNLEALIIVFMFASGLSAALLLGNQTPAQADVNEAVVFDPMAISRIAEKNAKAVVAIETTLKTSASPRDPFFEEFRRFYYFPDLPLERKAPKGYGSGFIIDSRGYIVTNFHVVRNAQTVEVRLLGEEKSYSAEVLDVNPEIDTAVLRIKANKKLPFIPWGSSEKTRVGEWVIAIGNPLGMEHTVTVGVLSAKDRQIVAQIGKRNQLFENLLQTDAAINPGNSGGPLINLKGQVIGINSIINSAGQNLGFAHPVDNIKDFVQDVITYGKSRQAWLGVAVTGLARLDSDTKTYFGLDKLSSGIIIQHVAVDSPAAKAGLQKYDVMLEIDKFTLKHGKDLVEYIDKKEPGSEVTCLINRKGQLKVVKAVLAEKPSIE